MSSSLTVYVMDVYDNPMEGEKVFCNFAGQTSEDINNRKYTNGEGIAEFQDIPAGPVTIYVVGEQVDENIEEGEHKVIKIMV